MPPGVNPPRFASWGFTGGKESAWLTGPFGCIPAVENIWVKLPPPPELGGMEEGLDCGAGLLAVGEPPLLNGSLWSGMELAAAAGEYGLSSVENICVNEPPLLAGVGAGAVGAGVGAVGVA